jgi:hypothetical protein
VPVVSGNGSPGRSRHCSRRRLRPWVFGLHCRAVRPPLLSVGARLLASILLMGEQMDETAWMSSEDPLELLRRVNEQAVASARRLRLLACACCHLVSKHLTYEHARDAVEVAEQFADGQATEEGIRVAYDSLIGTIRGSGELSELLRIDDPAYWAALTARGAARLIGQTDGRDLDAWSSLISSFKLTRVRAMFLRCRGIETWDLHDAKQRARRAMTASRSCDGRDPWEEESLAEAECADARREVCELIRDVFGNSLRAGTCDGAWLECRQGAVAAIAEGIYKSRTFNSLPILADALVHAGCDNEELLAHCRGTGPHVRGCWAIDLVLAKA